MKAVSLISFRDELLKIAMSVDAETRNNTAMRHEEPDFLLEGRLASNDSKETGFIPKLGEEEPPDGREKLQAKYRKLRKPGAAALKGGLAGSFLGQMITGGQLGGSGHWAKRTGLRGFGALGAGAGLADYYAQKRYKRERRRESSKIKAAMMGSSTFTPGRALTAARNTGAFQTKVIHKGAKLRPATMGKAFRFPQEV